MVQNRNNLIELFIGNISNSIVHQILEKAIDEEDIRKHYNKELLTSLDVAKRYRAKINPQNAKLPEKDISYIKDKVIIKVMAELKLRISKGYQNIDLRLVKPTVDKILNETKVK